MAKDGSRRRDLLHRNQLEAFAVWAEGEGYNREETKGVWEALRIRLYDPAGTHLPVIIYDRAKGDHLTTFGEGTALVQRWLKEKRNR